MGSSYSTEKPELDVEAPELDEEVVSEYQTQFERQQEELDSLFIYWWA